VLTCGTIKKKLKKENKNIKNFEKNIGKNKGGVAHLDKMGLAKDKKEKNCEGLALGGGSATPKGHMATLMAKPSKKNKN
jgi:hypothetical protein